MLIELLPYLFFLILTVVIPQLFKKKVYVFLLFILFFIICGFRYGVGWDYFNYADSIIAGDWRVDRYEYLVRKLAYYCHDIKSPRLFFVITSFFTIFCYFYTVTKKSIDIPVSLLTFLCLPVFFLSTLSTIRFSLSVAIVFLAYHFFTMKKNWVCIFLAVVAFFIHRAAIFGVFTLPFIIMNVNYSNRTNITILIVCIIIGTFFNAFPVFSNLASSVLDIINNEEMSQSVENYMDVRNSGFSRTPFLYAIIDVILLLTLNNNNKDNEDKQLGLYLTMYNIGCSITFLLSFNPTFASRLGQFFLVFVLLAVPYLRKNSIQRFTIISILIFVFFFQLSIRGTHPDFIGRVNCFLPYSMSFVF